ncbi:MAG TPA: GNAT family N-acetyltransferase [Actinomycetes bacterium]|jgi:ribosomal protein S18 acetylase RimI-like enzyme|nr:GNAT family N-acetyltransferase [Actinomycetes bacterium]
MSLTQEVIEDVRRVVVSEGVNALLVDDLTKDDLPLIAWAGGPSHAANVGRTLERVVAGEVEYLAVRARNGQPIALGGIDYTEHHGAGTLSQLASAAQSLGIGTHLIRAAEERIRSRGLRTAMMGVEDNNPRARALYERLGYRECGREKASWEEHDADGCPFLYETELTFLKKDLVQAG